MESLAKVAIYQLKVGKVSVTGHNINIVTIGHHQDRINPRNDGGENDRLEMAG